MERILKSSPFIPFEPNIAVLVQSEGQPITPIDAGGYHPLEYTGWWDEEMSWHDTCYIHAGLNPANVYSVKGPDALKFFADNCVNTFNNYPIGKGKHAIMCNEEGYIIKDGMLLRMGEDEFLTYWMWPFLEYFVQNGKYDIEGENLAGKIFMFQLAGPRTLDVLETATGEDLRDIKFIHFRDSKIAGKKVMILRVGMAGSLGYEVHGQREDAVEIYEAILKAGEPFGLKKLGRNAYRNAHIEGGFPQSSIHFTYAADATISDFLSKVGLWGGEKKLSGSIGNDLKAHFRTPVEIGWGGMINFDHDFTGREALEREKANPRRKLVTLVWNPEDIMEVWHSVFEPGEPYARMDLCEDWSNIAGTSNLHADKVLIGDEFVGISSGLSSYILFWDV